MQKYLIPHYKEKYDLLQKATKIAAAGYKRGVSLQKAGATSKQDLEALHIAYLDKQRITADIKMELEKLEFRAPFTGILGDYKYTSGAHIKAGEELVSLYNKDKLRVVVDIPSGILSQVETGTKVIIKGKYYRVKSVSCVIDPKTKMAKAEIECDDLSLIIGSNVYVDLVLYENDNAIIVPVKAIFINKGESFIYLINNGKLQQQKVIRGKKIAAFVEIIKGLKVGDRIVKKNVKRLRSQMKVKIYSPKSKKAKS